MDICVYVCAARALELFDLLEALCAEKKSNPSVDRKRLALWPVMILLLSISDRACDSPGTDDLLNSHHQESRFLQKLQSSLRSTSKTQRDTAVLCCLSLCKCAGYSTEKSLLWRVGAGLMPMVSVILAFLFLFFLLCLDILEVGLALGIPCLDMTLTRDIWLAYTDPSVAQSGAARTMVVEVGFGRPHTHVPVLSMRITTECAVYVEHVQCMHWAPPDV